MLAVDAFATSRSPEPDALWWMVLTIVMALPGLILGYLVTRHHRRNPVGALLGCAGLLLLAFGASDSYFAVAQQQPTLPVNGILVSLIQGSWMLLYLPWALVLLLYPAGRLETRGARNIAAGLCLTALCFMVLAGLTQTPYADPFQDTYRGLPGVPGADVAAVILLPVFLTLLVLSVVHVTKRFKTSGTDSKNQLRWLAVAGLCIPGTLLLCWGGYLLGGTQWPVLLGLVLMNLLIPAALAIGLLGAKRFDAGRMLVFLTEMIVVPGTVLALATVLMHWPGYASSMAAVFTVSLIAAAALVMAGLRPHIRGWAGRIFYAEHEKIMVALARLEENVLAHRARPTELQETLREATGDANLRIGYLDVSDARFHDSAGRELERGTALPVGWDGKTIGLVQTTEGHARSFTPAGIKAMAPIIEMGRQQLELAKALSEVHASRKRLLLAAHQERQRLERDLHDGAQQRLVALGMGLRRIQRQLPEGSEQVRSALDASVAELGTAVAELRQLAHGIRPSALDEGLAVALRQLSGRSPTPLSLAIVDPLPEVPDMVAATVYFVASEAIHNAVKHAQAKLISLTLETHETALRLRVSDDGCGGAKQCVGGGLSGLEDRVKALGGKLGIASPEGNGTTIEAVLPCA